MNHLWIIGIGSNVGDRHEYIKEALNMIPLVNMSQSSVYENAPLLPPHTQRTKEDADYLNIVVSGYSTLGPENMLKCVKRIEKILGRKERGKWARREIDIDLLFYGQQIIHTHELVIPHVGIQYRDFVLAPLSEIHPSFKHPIINKSIASMRSILESQQTQVR